MIEIINLIVKSNLNSKRLQSILSEALYTNIVKDNLMVGKHYQIYEFLYSNDINIEKFIENIDFYH